MMEIVLLSTADHRVLAMVVAHILVRRFSPWLVGLMCLTYLAIFQLLETLACYQVSSAAGASAMLYWRGSRRTFGQG
jgi:hypothetical protein